MPVPYVAPWVRPILKLRERLYAWAAPKEHLAGEIQKLKARIHAMQCERTEALSNALLFENADITGWLREIASTDKGALGIKVKTLEGEIKAVKASVKPLAESERRARETLDAVLEAWALAAGTKIGVWNKITEAWDVTREIEEVLPQDVLTALRVWINKSRRPTDPEPRAKAK